MTSSNFLSEDTYVLHPETRFDHSSAEEQQKPLIWQVYHVPSCYCLLSKAQPDTTTVCQSPNYRNLLACLVATQIQTSSESLPVIPGFILNPIHRSGRACYIWTDISFI